MLGRLIRDRVGAIGHEGASIGGRHDMFGIHDPLLAVRIRERPRLSDLLGQQRRRLGDGIDIEPVAEAAVSVLQPIVADRLQQARSVIGYGRIVELAVGRDLRRNLVLKLLAIVLTFVKRGKTGEAVTPKVAPEAVRLVLEIELVG